MPSTTIRPDEVKVINTPARYLTIIEATHRFDITAEGLGVLIGEASAQFDLEGFTRIEVKNNAQENLVILYENANRLSTRNNAAVQVTNQVEVSRIGELPNVAFEANIDAIERIGVASSNTLAALPQVIIPANASRLVIGPREAVARQVTIQTLSETETTLRIGSNETIDATRGIILRGSINSLSSAQFTTTAAIRIYNDSDNDAIVAVMEQYTA